MKSIFAILLGIGSAMPTGDIWEQLVIDDLTKVDHVKAFGSWKKAFNKQYKSLEDEGKHFLQFLDNWNLINEFNKEGHSYTMKLNQFGDMTVDEFQLHIHGHSGSCKGKNDKNSDNLLGMTYLGDVPTSIDWTDINGTTYVTPVKNQGQCGSCWAFSTTGSLESRSAIKNKQTGANIISLSEQQLVDCSTAEGNQGCNGGLMDNAFQYIEKSGGLCTEKEYPYTGRDGKCKSSTCGTKYDPITGYKDVQHNSEPSLQSAVADGPVSVAVDAAGTTWQFYHGGVVDGHCGQLLDHGVLAVGYGHDDSAKLDYWKVKNSWGVTWGEKGYIRLCRNCDKDGGAGECGILKEPSYPTV